MGQLHYRRADILHKTALYTAALTTLDEAIKATEKLPTSERIKARDIVKAFKERLIEEQRQARSKRLRAQANAAEAVAAEASRQTRIAQQIRSNHFGRLLPPDVLVMICEHGLKTDGAFAVRMGGVCQIWRSAIYGQKKLWQSLTVGNKHAVSKAGLWVKWSGGYLKELCFSPQFDIQRADAVGLLVEPCISGIRKLEVRANIVDLLVKWKHRFANLEHLVIAFTLDGSAIRATPVSIQPFDFGLPDPTKATLRTLELRGVILSTPIRIRPSVDMTAPDGHAEATTTPLVLTLSNVRHLSLDFSWICFTDREDSGRRGIFNWMPQLDSIDLNGVTILPRSRLDRSAPNATDNVDGDMADNTTLGRTELSQLRQYREQNLLTYAGAGLFQAELDAPALQELAVCQSTCRDLSNLLGPGFTPAILTSLDVSKIVLDQHSLLAFLRLTPSLRFLNVSYCGLEDPFLLALEHRDGLDDQIVPQLEALSICNSAISGGAVRDFVNSRLPREKRMISIQQTKTKAPMRSAFRPTSSRPQVTPIVPTPSLAELDTSVFSTQPGLPPVPRPSIKWLCLDECADIKPEYITLLKKHVGYVSWWLGSPNEERQKGLGRWYWDGGIDSCVDEPTGGCYMRQYERGKWTIVHRCKKVVVEEEEQVKAEEQGWSRSGSDKLSTL